MSIRGNAFRIVAIVAMLVAGTATTAAFDLSNAAYAPTLGPTSIPIGHAQFCKTFNDECKPNANLSEVAMLTEDRWQQLIDVNNRFNSEIVPITDEDLYKVGELWTYPEGYGDCEDYVLAKRRALIDSGWDQSTLLITVVRERNGAGHAVLLVRTDRGDLVLDNQDALVKVWNETPYQFVKRQSQADAGLWVLIDDTRGVVTVASTN